MSVLILRQLLDMLVGHTVHAETPISMNCKQEFGHEFSNSIIPLHSQNDE